MGEEADTKQFRSLKADVVVGVLKKMANSMENQEFFENLLSFMDAVMIKNKYRGDEASELSIVSHRLVEADTLEFFYEQLFKPNEAAFRNAVSYLLLVANRMNADEEVDPYYSRLYPNYVQQPTMHFQPGLLYSQFTTLITLNIPDTYVLIN